jgi:hypothetical protein
MAIVTISRLAGSQGDEIARALSAKTGLRLLGHEDFHALAHRHDPELGRKLERFFNDEGPDRKSTRLNSSHNPASRMPSSA